MIEIALQNLKLLNDETVNIAEKYLISEGNKLSFIAKDNFDPIQNGKLLEYPIYFTYNQVLNEISDNCELSYKQRKYLLNQIDSSLDNLYELINNETDSDDKDNNLDEIIHEIDDRYSIVREKTVITTFEFYFYILMISLMLYAKQVNIYMLHLFSRIKKKKKKKMMKKKKKMMKKKI